MRSISWSVQRNALRDFTKATELRPVFAEAHQLRGYTLYQLGKLDLALSALNEAIRLDESVTTFFNNRGLVFGAKGDAKRQLADLSKAIHLDPDYSAAYTNCAAAKLVLA